MTSTLDIDASGPWCGTCAGSTTTSAGCCFLDVAGLDVPPAGWIVYGVGLASWAIAAAVKNSLKALREARGWTQGALADRPDVSRQTVNALEKARYDPSVPLAFRIARLFDKPIEAIFEPEPEPDPVGTP